MNRAHTSQQDLLHKLQERAARVKKLEEACRQQEKVIERMERILQSSKQPGPKDKRSETFFRKDFSSLDFCICLSF